MDRPVQFSESLACLISDRFSSRKQFATLAGITQSRLSQLIAGQGKPSVENLVRFANILNVSLDQLVFGEALPSSNPQFVPFIEHMNRSLSDALTTSGSVTTACYRMIDSLRPLILKQARNLATHSEKVMASTVLTETEALRLEGYSMNTIVIWSPIDFDLKNQKEFRPFDPIVARNLRRGYRYSFIFPAELADHNRIQKIVERQVARLQQTHRVPFDRIRQACFFYRGNFSVLSSSIYMEIDRVALKDNDPAFSERLNSHFGQKDKSAIAYTFVGHTVQNSLLMDQKYLANFRQLCSIFFAPESSMLVPLNL